MIDAPHFGDGTPGVWPLIPAGEDRFTVTAGRYVGEDLELTRDVARVVDGFIAAGCRHWRA